MFPFLNYEINSFSSFYFKNTKQKKIIFMLLELFFRYKLSSFSIRFINLFEFIYTLCFIKNLKR
jgi:hypothetical protein